MSIHNRLKKLEDFRSNGPVTCPACSKPVYCIERPALGEAAHCIHCNAELPEVPAGVVVKNYIGVGFTDL